MENCLLFIDYLKKKNIKPLEYLDLSLEDQFKLWNKFLWDLRKGKIYSETIG
jgi:hypothetical protein